MKSRAFLLLCAALMPVALSAGVFRRAYYYHSHLRTASGALVHWKTSPVKYVIQAAGSDNIADGSDDAAIRLAFKAWQDLPGSTIAFTEDTTPSQKARTDVDSTDIHLMIFDENNNTGWFPNGSGIIAITPTAFFTAPASVAGNIGDSDIIFNGRDVTFSTTGAVGTIDLQSVATHEAGHFLGLDHEVLQGATMYPFLATQQFNQRTPTSDDAAGAEFIYPGLSKGKIAGFVKRSSDSTVVKGAHVSARNTTDGRVATATYTDSTGAFTITGLDPGTYRLTVGVLDGPVVDANYGDNTLGVATPDTDFQAFQSGDVAVVGTSTTNAGDLLVGVSPTLNITNPAKVTTMHPGEQKVMHFSGSLPAVANAEVTMPDTASNFMLQYSAGNNLTVTAGASVPAGIYDIFMRDMSNNQKTVHAGAIEVLPAVPGISNAVPAASSTSGGTSITINGTNLDTTTAVLFGDATGSNLNIVSPTQITVTTPAHAAGFVDLVVQTAGGEEARLSLGFGFGDAVQPALTAIFPATGGTAGNAAVSLSGTQFVPGATVKFNNTAAASVTFVDATQLLVTAPALGAGVYDVTVTNPGAIPLSSTLAASYTAVAGTSPVIHSVVPGSVSYLGGDAATIQGSGFLANAALTLFASLKTGTGGTAVVPGSVESNQIQFVAPAGPVGDASLIVTNTDGLMAVKDSVLSYAPVFNNSGTLKGVIQPSTDLDDVIVDTVAGALVTGTLAASGSTLQPKLKLVDANSVVLVSTDSGDPEFDATFAKASAKSASITKFNIPATGRYRWVLSSLGGTSGKYKFTCKETLPASAKTVKVLKNQVGPQVSNLHFNAKSGSTLKGKITASKGLAIQVVDLSDLSGSILGDPGVASKIVVSASGNSIQFNSVPLAALDAYVLQIGASNGASGTISGTLTIVPPKLPTSVTEK